MTYYIRCILPFLFFITSIVSLQAQSDITLPSSFEANFEQSITSDRGKKISYSGKVHCSLPYIKWNYITPTKKDVCSDTQELIVVDHDLEQIAIYQMDDNLDLAAIIKNAKPHRKTVYIALYKNRSYTLQVDAKQRLSRIAYKDNLDNNVLIIFKNMRYSNKKIAEQEMKCVMPTSYDQIGG